jgi:predicted Zn-dependent protease
MMSIVRSAMTALLAFLTLATAGSQPVDLESRRRAAAQAVTDGRFEEAGAIYLSLGKPDMAVDPLERAAAARPSDVRVLRMLAAAYAGSGRPMDAVTTMRTVTTVAPDLPAGWYALGQAYNAIKQDALGTFTDRPDELSWRQLLVADARHAAGKLIDAFVMYRATLERLPSMIAIHDSIAQVYEKSGHADWAARERAKGKTSVADCAGRRAMCEFRAGRHDSALTEALAGSDPESRYWRARAANELALSAFKRLDGLADSRERRAVRATQARAEERYVDAIAELKAGLELAPGDPALLYELGSCSYLARDFDRAISILSPLLEANPTDARLLKLVGFSLLQLQRPEEALPVLQRADERDATDPGVRLAIGRAHLQTGNFAAAVPLIEAQLAGDEDGSLHVQLARAYTGLGQREKASALLSRSQELQRASHDRNALASRRTIAPPD